MTVPLLSSTMVTSMRMSAVGFAGFGGPEILVLHVERSRREHALAAGGPRSTSEPLSARY